MTNENAVRIIMLDGCTRSEAEGHLEKGSVVFPDFQENIDLYVNELNAFDEKDLREMAKTGKPMEDWGVVKEDGKTYFIMYVL